MKSIELESLLQTTEFISRELSQIKDDIEKQKTHADYPETSAVSYIERAIRLRQSFRSMADGIEGKRSLVQLQKEKIQKSKNFIQGLQYYKTTLINKIQEAHIEVSDLQEFQESPLKVVNWIEDYPKIDSHLNDELRKKQEQKEQLKQLVQQKAEKQQEGKLKKDLYEKILPERAHKIYQEVLQTAKLCEIKELESFADIQNPKLSVVNEKLNALRINSTVQVNYSKDVHQELQIILLKNKFNLFKLANLNKVSVEQHQIKLTIASLEAPLNQLVIGIDRREDFSNQEIFQRLFNDELIQSVFPNPQNESQRNVNAKYIKVKWLEDSFLTGVISPLQFVNKIKERVFSLMLVTYLSQNMKKIGFFFPLTTEQEVQGPINLQSVFKKTMNGSLQKINFQEYLKEMHVPSWVHKYRLKYAQLQAKRQTLNFEDQNTYNIDKSNYLTVLRLLKLEELQEPNLNNYYRGTLQIHQGKLQFFLVIPFAYPRKLSKVVITNWQKKREEEKKLGGLEHIPCIAKLNAPKKTFSKKIMTFEKEVNEDIYHFYRDPENQPFRVLLQINRLISLLGLHAQKKL